VIFFPRGVGAIAQKYAVLPACDAISIDTGQDWGWAKANLCPHATVQGGLDPLLPIIGGDVMLDETRRLLDAFAGAPYIFNLGHGLTPETPPENVGALVDFIRKTN